MESKILSKNLISSYFWAKLRKFFFINNLNICNVSDLYFPFIQKKIKFLCPYTNKSFFQTVGIYKLSNVILGRNTGWIFLAPKKKFVRPICLKESSFDDHNEFLLSLHKFNNTDIYIDLNEKKFKKPVLIFNITRKKKNYYHFFVEDAPHLIWQLTILKKSVNILVHKDQPNFVKNFLSEISRHYNSEIIYIDPSENISIKSTIFVSEDTLKRKYGSNIENLSLNKDLLKKQIKFLFDDEDKNFKILEFRDQNISPRSVEISFNDKKIRLKSNTLQALPSVSSIDMLQKFSQSICRKTNKKVINKIFISRFRDSKRGRNLKNENDLIKSIKNLKKISFGNLSLYEQIKKCKSSNVLVGLHGAGLTNMIFFEKKSTIIEIIPKLQSLPISDLFSNLAKICGHKYYRFFSSELDSEGLTVLSSEVIQDISDVIKKVK